ncbi:hypothetical protein llap_6262 [Limosa lapponica baueri]|uniref:Uncharacterized protein n=1 Tax=Limosa lapponica baueri TaxID=1758121 RepID=A0A2I0UBI5_LIMLA|nr:hypothetical protein llap_6262 [Limosa lapponica baueri]
MVNLLSTRTPRSLSAELISSGSDPNLYHCVELFLPQCSTLHLPLFNFIKFLSAQLSSLYRSRNMVAQPSGVSATPPSFVSSANLLRVHSVPSSQVIDEYVEQDWTQYGPLVITSSYRPQLDFSPLITTL